MAIMMTVGRDDGGDGNDSNRDEDDGRDDWWHWWFAMILIFIVVDIVNCIPCHSFFLKLIYLGFTFSFVQEVKPNYVEILKDLSLPIEKVITAVALLWTLNA